MKSINCIKKFLRLNGWVYDKESKMYHNPNNISFAIEGGYLIFVGGNGDFKHHLIQEYSYYYLIGWLIEHKLLSISYQSVELKGE